MWQKREEGKEERMLFQLLILLTVKASIQHFFFNDIPSIFPYHHHHHHLHASGELYVRFFLDFHERGMNQICIPERESSYTYPGASPCFTWKPFNYPNYCCFLVVENSNKTKSSFSPKCVTIEKSFFLPIPLMPSVHRLTILVYLSLSLSFNESQQSCFQEIRLIFH